MSRLRVRDHENATTAASERLVKEKDDLQSQVKRLDKEIVTLKKQLVGAKFKIGNLDKGWKVERESAEQSQNAMQAVKAQLDVAQAEVEAIRLQLQQKQAELDTATTEHKAALEAKQKLQQTLDLVNRKNETLEQGNKVLVQEILTLKNEAQNRATGHANQITSLKNTHGEELKAVRTNLETARKELSAARRQGQAEEKTIADLRAEKAALAKRVEAQKSTEEEVERLRKELADSTALLQKEKSNFADVVNDKNKQLSSLGNAVQVAITKASTANEQLKKLRQESKNEAGKWMRRNAELGTSIEEKEAQLAKVKADLERLQTASESRVQENASLREKLAAQTGKLEEREKLYQGLVKEVVTLNSEAQKRETARKSLELELATQTANCRELEQQKERLEVDLALKSKPDPVVVQRDMDALEQRVREEEAKKYAEEIAKLKTENAMLATKISTRTSDAAHAGTPSPRSARTTSSKRRHAEMDESEKKQYAEKVGETFFDAEGICIACR